MKMRLHLVLAFTFGLLAAALLPIFISDSSLEVQAQSASATPSPQAAAARVPYELRAPVAVATLPAGNDYYHIDAQVPAGQTAGVPSVVGGPSGSDSESRLFMAHENGGIMSFGSGMVAPSLWKFESGNDPYGRSIVNDLRHMPDGSPLLIGASSSTRALPNSQEATVWQMSGSSLVPIALGFPDNGTTGTSRLAGGNATDGYAGSTADPIFVPPTGGGHTLDAGGVFRAGIAFDLDNFTTVGAVDFHAAFWSRDNQGSWKFGTLQLPDWSDGTGAISDVADGKMGGYLYKPDLDDIVPVLWNTDGTLNKVFDLPGYSVAEMVVDDGSVVALLNQGTDGLFSGPSRLYADGWNDSRLYFGDIVPALPSGSSGYVVDISAGGSIFALAEISGANGLSYGVAHLATSIPEPTTIALFGGALFVFALRRLRTE